MTDVKSDASEGREMAPWEIQEVEEMSPLFREMLIRSRIEAAQDDAKEAEEEAARQRDPLWNPLQDYDEFNKLEANGNSNMTARRARNAIVRDAGLRMIGEKQWLDPETAKACKEMRLEMLEVREPTAQEMGLFFYLREPMLKDPTYLVAVWERERKHPILFKRYATIGAALSGMQQSFRAERSRAYAGDWSDMYGEG